MLNTNWLYLKSSWTQKSVTEHCVFFLAKWLKIFDFWYISKIKNHKNRKIYFFLFQNIALCCGQKKSKKFFFEGWGCISLTWIGSQSKIDKYKLILVDLTWIINTIFCVSQKTVNSPEAKKLIYYTIIILYTTRRYLCMWTQIKYLFLRLNRFLIL